MLTTHIVSTTFFSPSFVNQALIGRLGVSCVCSTLRTDSGTVSFVPLVNTNSMPFLPDEAMVT